MRPAGGQQQQLVWMDLGSRLIRPSNQRPLSRIRQWTFCLPQMCCSAHPSLARLFVVARSSFFRWVPPFHPFQYRSKMRVASAACLAAIASTASAFTTTVSPSVARHYAATSTTLNMAEKLSQDELKKMVGYKSVDDYVKSGMVVGLGTGSTAYYAVERVGELLKSGELKDIVCIPTSVRTKEQAESLDIPLVTLDTHSKLDVAIDGADEVDPDLNLVKGGGGALLREKMVEVCADKFIVIGEL